MDPARRPLCRYAVNELTLDCGERGREAVQRLLIEDHERGIIPRAVDDEFSE